MDIAPKVWRQLGAVPRDVFQRIRSELDALAPLASQQPLPSLALVKSPNSPAALSFFVENFVALYEVDEERRTIILREVTQRAPLDSGTGEEGPVR